MQSMRSEDVGTGVGIRRLINPTIWGRTIKSDSIKPETTCGYRTQGKHIECCGYDFACAKNGHPWHDWRIQFAACSNHVIVQLLLCVWFI